MDSDKFAIDLSKDERYNPSSLEGEFLNALTEVLKYYVYKEENNE